MQTIINKECGIWTRQLFSALMFMYKKSLVRGEILADS